VLFCLIDEAYRLLNPRVDEYAALKKLSEELKRAKVPQEQAELITYRVLKVMIEDPSGAGQFTGEVAKAS